MIATGCGRLGFDPYGDDTPVLTIEPRYPAAPGFTDWIARDGAACSGDSTLARRDCIHGGPLRRAVLADASCSDVAAHDVLDQFLWECTESGADAVLIATELRGSARDLLDASGWRSNRLEVTRAGNVIAQSEDLAWWPNAVVALDSVAVVEGATGAPGVTGIVGDGTVIALELGAAGTIYTLDGDRALPSIMVAAAGTAFVTLGSATLAHTGASNSCVRDAGLDAPCVIATTPAARFALVSATIQAATAYGIVASEPTFVTISASAITGPSNGIAITNGTATAVAATSLLDVGAGVTITGGRGHVLDTVRVIGRGSGTGVLVTGGMRHDLRRTSVTGMTTSVRVTDSPEVRLHDVESANARSVGIHIGGASPDAVLTDLVSTNSGLQGILVDGTAHNVTLVGALAANSFDEGITLWGVTRATATHLTGIANEQFGVNTYLGAHYASVSQVNAANNGAYGLFVRGSSFGLYSQIAVTNNAFQQARVYQNSDFNTFTHSLAGGPGTLCLVDGGGVDNNSVVTDDSLSACGGDDPALDFRATSGLTQADQFAGLVIADATNAHQAALAAMQPLTATAITDWLDFDHPLRFWGTGQSTTFLDASNRLDCVDPEPCRAWDARLLATNPFRGASGTGRTANEPFVDGMPCPAAVHGDQTTHDLRGSEVAGDGVGDEDSVCEVFEKCTDQSIFLLNARELLEDEVGDDDGLCESNETCVYSPNFGYYQGTGDPRTGPRCTFVDGTGAFAVTGVKMLAHPSE
ncbi:MAG TPA: right-handed parallel beta-helix repeat-containing protein [Kofleriaceae bacterium]|nr:right-handed parallel beta-helix repeat-containing protein [Kofleriaceae bacterium]